MVESRIRFPGVSKNTIRNYRGPVNTPRPKPDPDLPVENAAGSSSYNFGGGPKGDMANEWARAGQAASRFIVYVPFGQSLPLNVPAMHVLAPVPAMHVLASGNVKFNNKKT